MNSDGGEMNKKEERRTPLLQRAQVDEQRTEKWEGLKLQSGRGSIQSLTPSYSCVRDSLADLTD